MFVLPKCLTDIVKLFRTAGEGLLCKLEGAWSFVEFHSHTNKSTLDKIGEADNLPTWDGGEWPGGGTSSGGGHTIQSSGVAMEQRANLNLIGFDVSDDETNDATIIVAGRDRLIRLYIYQNISGGL